MGSAAYAIREKIENMVQCCAFRSIILIRLYFEKSIYFYIRNNYYSYSFAMKLVIAHGNF